MRVVFAGTPEFAAIALRHLLDAGFEICAVYTQPDRPAGRGRKVRLGPVKTLALEHGLALEQPPSLKGAAEQGVLRQYRPDVAVVAAYGLILPSTVLAIPTHGCVNIHASVLPRWRGAAPIQRAIMAGDRETGVTIMQMDEGLDTGDIITVATCPIAANDTGGTLHDRLAEMGAQQIVEVLKHLSSTPLPKIPQPKAGSTYARRLGKDDGLVDWTTSAVTIERQIRALLPTPTAFAPFPRGDDWERTKIWAAHLGETSKPTPAHPAGQLLLADRTGIEIQTGDGTVRLTRLQRPGGKPVAARDYLNASRLCAGQTLIPPSELRPERQTTKNANRSSGDVSP